MISQRVSQCQSCRPTLNGDVLVTAFLGQMEGDLFNVVKNVFNVFATRSNKIRIQSKYVFKTAQYNYIAVVCLHREEEVIEQLYLSLC